MSVQAARAHCLLAASAISMIAYAASLSDPSTVLMALIVAGLGVVVTGPRIAVRVPRLASGIATVGVLLWTILIALEQGLDILTFGGFVAWMMVIKAFDRRSPGDDAQLLAFSIFLAVASILLNNGLVVAFLTLVYLPFAAYAAMHLQLRISLDRAMKYSRRGVSGPLPPVRPAASSSAAASLTRTSLVALCLGLMFAAVVFVVVPRGAGIRQLGAWGNPGAGRVVGFSKRVNVGTGGTVSVSRTPVLHLKVMTSDGSAYGGLGAVQYLRGAVLDTYEDGSWVSSLPPEYEGEVRQRSPEDPVRFDGSGAGAMIYQRITLLNTPNDFTPLFTVWRPLTIAPDEPADIRIVDEHHSVAADHSGGRFEYTVRSSPFDSPHRPKFRRERTGWSSPVVAQKAREILDGVGIEADPARRPIADDGMAISAFRQYFWSNYTYSLGEPPPPRRVDPIDWFLTEADRGHCEHYAAALAALCRSVGIPARVITGYLAVEYNRSTEHYVVRQSNAHAWVEAQYEPGMWQPYDATPPQSIMDIHGPEPGLWARVGRWFDTLNYRWIASIVSFDAAARSDLLSWGETDAAQLGERANSMLRHFRVAPPSEIAVLALRLFVLLTAVVFGVYGLWVLGRRLVRRALAWLTGGSTRARAKAAPFLKDAMRLLHRAGYQKPDWQPVGAWSRSLGESRPELGQVVGELSDLFYAVRFGGRDLGADERSRADALVGRLRAVLERAPRPHRFSDSGSPEHSA